jgi:hypothetical protein
MLQPRAAHGLSPRLSRPQFLVSVYQPVSRAKAGSASFVFEPGITGAWWIAAEAEIAKLSARGLQAKTKHSFWIEH